MNKVLTLVLGYLVMAGTLTGQEYTDSFPISGTELTWVSGYFDSLDSPLCVMRTTGMNTPGGDNFVGKLVADGPYLGGLGLAYAGTAGLADYSVEAQVYVDLDSAYYSGLMSRLVITESTAEAYQLVTNFSSPLYPGGPPIARVRFRHWNQNQDITILGEWEASELPGGAPAEDGWHHLKLEARGNEFWCYWDGQLMGDGPITDTTAAPIDSGYFGVYIWDVFALTLQAIKLDDLAVYDFSSTNSVEPGMERFTPAVYTLLQNYPNPFNPFTNIPLRVEEGGRYSLVVSDINGRQVRSLLNEALVPNNYTIVWDGRDQSGKLVSSGVYLYTLNNGSQRISKRMVLLK